MGHYSCLDISGIINTEFLGTILLKNNNSNKMANMYMTYKVTYDADGRFTTIFNQKKYNKHEKLSRERERERFITVCTLRVHNKPLVFI